MTQSYKCDIDVTKQEVVKMFIAGFFIGMVAGIIAWNVALKKPQD